MILKKLRVQNFKCIEDSGSFAAAAVTCLVGKNESGKTALLEALYKLNPVAKDAAILDPLIEYPRRHWSEYKERAETNPDNVLTTEWELQAEDRRALEAALGPTPVVGDCVTITKGYDNELHYMLATDEKQVVQFYVGTSSLFDEEKVMVSRTETVADAIKALEDTPSPSDRHSALLTALKRSFPKGTLADAVVNILSKRLPKILYFSSYYTLPGQVALNALNQRNSSKQLTDSDRVFLALLDLAGTSIREISASGKFEALVAELEAVSNRLTQEIFKYWSQNRHLAIEFRFDAARPQDPPPLNEGHVFRTRIRNSRHGVTVGFDERSSGFIWFFSFLVWFSQVRKIYGDNLLILLDEPALNLHARAQADLLRYMNEQLKPNYQVIYTTHSPWMIDPNNLPGTRTVEDVITKGGDILGSKVREDVLVVDPDTVFPLQGALGYEITQTLFIGEHNLLVEGPSDLLYLKWFSNELRSRGRTGLDHRWVTCPVGGVDKVSSFVALFGGNKLHVAVFTDVHKGQKAKVRSLKESNLLKQGHVFTAAMFVGQGEADTEDMIGRANYVRLVDLCYGLVGAQVFPEKRPAKAPDRLLEEVQAHFATLPPGAPTFDHFAPAAYLLENGAAVRTKLPDLEPALDRFEKLFIDLNALLPVK